MGNVGYAPPTEPVTQCNLCGSRKWIRLAHKDRYGLPASPNMCSRCGLVFLSPRPTQRAYATFYQALYRPLLSDYYGRPITTASIQAEQSLYTAELIRLLTPWMQAGYRSLLDIGGSTGITAAAFTRQFDLLEGAIIDPSPAETAHAKGLNVFNGFVEDFESSCTYDIVLMCQTVDHLLDIGRTLMKVRQLINLKGLLFVDIVDFRAAYLRTQSIEKAIKVDHPYYLTDSTMRVYLSQWGFDVVHTEIAQDSLHIGYVCRPTISTIALPAASEVSEMLREIRFVQNYKS